MAGTAEHHERALMAAAAFTMRKRAWAVRARRA
jgi:hypothetical protein